MNYTERKISHFKMYKVKKQWLFTGMGFLAMSGTLLFGSVSVKADTTQSTGSSVTTTQVGVTTSDDALNQTTTEPNGTKSDNKLQTTGTDKEGTQVPDDTANSIGSAEPGSTDDAVVSNPATDTASKTDETAETTPTVSTPTTAGTMQRRVMLRKQAAVKQAAPTAATDIPDGDADSATNAKQDYLDYATGEYATAMTNYQTQSDAINTQIAAYQASKDAYDSALADYQTSLLRSSRTRLAIKLTRKPNYRRHTQCLRISINSFRHNWPRSTLQLQWQMRLMMRRMQRCRQSMKRCHKVCKMRGLKSKITMKR
ncbi:KxYKxGKxW signal peptide domain-containing protein [Secundilactobacillus collinoides]|uniref:KxYKxGKxW signal peptide domain-containing protein n=1 Tax=Secundilactobacillus collinoides TaxID=33960 RepID=UPI0006D247E1|nr:KxYKxGKxW signal peptide domain-containing protein [Secundilactobacillus collinoides]